jgi:hypothetical protein
MANCRPNSNVGYAAETDAQPCAQPDGPVCGSNLAHIGAARRLA